MSTASHSPQPLLDVFLSYNKSDHDIVEELGRLLMTRGMSTWLDEWNLVPGTDWQVEIEQALAQCRSVAVMIGPSGLGRWQAEEMRAAVNRRVNQTDGCFRVIPVLLPGARRDTLGVLPFLSTATCVGFKTTVHDPEALDKLICGIRGVKGSTDISERVELGKKRFYFILDGTFDEMNETRVSTILDLLRRYSGDATITLKELRSGSVTLVLEGTVLGYERLEFLVRTRALKEISGLQVLDVMANADALRSWDAPVSERATPSHATTFHSFDQNYIQRLTEGDPSTEAHFASYFGELIQLKLASRLRSRVLAEDIRQEALMRVLSALRRGVGIQYPERFGAFVNTVCNNVMYEYLRTAARERDTGAKVHEAPESAIDPDKQIDLDMQRQVSEVLSQLSARDRELLRAVFVEGWKKDEVRRTFGVDTSYLRALLHRARAKFLRSARYREHLKEQLRGTE